MRNTQKNSMTVRLSADLAEFATLVIGKPYTNGGRGPDTFDCGGLVHFFYKKVYGIDLGSFIGLDAGDVKVSSKLFEGAAESEQWEYLKEPQDGCVVALSKSRRFHHVGVWIPTDGGLVLHAFEGASVVANSVRRLKQDHFSRIAFFKYNG